MTPVTRTGLALQWAYFTRAVRQHPIPLFGIIETGFWLLILLSVADHLLRPNGTTAFLVWALTIGPHEIGHLVCSPFGYFVMLAGGSVWQILLWALLAAYSFLARRQITVALVFGMVAGHSFINLSRYVADARARKMPLLFGMDSSHHDWYNLLNMTHLLPLDTLFGVLCALIGVLILLAIVAAGIYTAWMLPRVRVWRGRRW